jgi:hypothetical protein
MMVGEAAAARRQLDIGDYPQSKSVMIITLQVDLETKHRFVTKSAGDLPIHSCPFRTALVRREK